MPDAHAQRALGALHDVSFRDGFLEGQRDGDGVFERAGKVGLALFQKRLVQVNMALHERGQYGAAAQIDLLAAGPVLDPRRYSRKPAPGDVQVHQWTARIDSGVPENSFVRHLCAHDHLTGTKHYPDRNETRIAHNLKMDKFDTANSIVPRRFSPAIKEGARKTPLSVSLTTPWIVDIMRHSEPYIISVLMGFDGPGTGIGGLAFRRTVPGPERDSHDHSEFHEHPRSQL